MLAGGNPASIFQPYFLLDAFKCVRYDDYKQTDTSAQKRKLQLPTVSNKE